jgi:outer membrane protein TolC
MNAIAAIPLLLALGQEAKPVAQEVPAVAVTVTGNPLTLDEALARAVEANYDLAAARAKLQQARQGVWKAWSGYLPQVSASGTYLRTPEVAVALGPTPIVVQPEEQFSGQIQATQALVVPVLWGMINAATHGVAAAEASVEGARREILFGVSQLFYGTASLRKVVEVQQRLFETARKHEKDADVRYRAGTIPKVGLLRAQIERAKSEQDLLRSRNGYEGMRLALATALDREADFDVVEPAEPALPADLVSLQDQALRDRPDVKAAREAEAAARGARWGTAGKYLPSLAAFGRYSMTDPAGLIGADKTWAAGLAVNWNILDGGLREAELREANAKIAETEATRKGAEAKARLEVKQATLDLQSAKANAQKASEQRDLARENQRLIDVSYAAGAATALEQADAQTALSAAEVAAEAEILNSKLAALRLLKAAGAFDPAAAKK